MNYYCNKCDSIVGKWKKKLNNFSSWKYTYIKDEGSCDLIKKLFCKKCNNNIGLLFIDVCVYCFDKDQIFEKDNLENFLIKFKTSVPKKSIIPIPNCLICDKKKHKSQHWFYDTSTILKD